MQKNHFDLVILGGGPAGLSAGLYAARARLDHVMIEKGAPGGQVLLTDWVDNYPGFPDGISGFDLVEKMSQAEFDRRMALCKTTLLNSIQLSRDGGVPRRLQRAMFAERVDAMLSS